MFNSINLENEKRAAAQKVVALVINDALTHKALEYVETPKHNDDRPVDQRSGEFPSPTEQHKPLYFHKVTRISGNLVDPVNTPQALVDKVKQCIHDALIRIGINPDGFSFTELSHDNRRNPVHYISPEHYGVYVDVTDEALAKLDFGKAEAYLRSIGSNIQADIVQRAKPAAEASSEKSRLGIVI